jgi:hypothetical protein
MSRRRLHVLSALATAGLAFGAPAPASAATVPGQPALVDFVGSNPSYTFTPTPRFVVTGVDGETIDLWEGGTLLGSGVVSGGGVRILVTAPLADGWHTIHATATDTAVPPNTSAPSESIDIVVDTAGPVATTPDLLAADDDGASSTDNVTSNPRPRFDVATEANARVTLYENGVALGSAVADGIGLATVGVSPILWLAPGTHKIYAIAFDSVANAGNATASLTVTIDAGVPPFTTNLGVLLGADDLVFRFRSSLAARASIRVFRSGRLVVSARRSLAAGTTRGRLRLPASARGARQLVVIARIVSGDGRVAVVRRTVRR